MFLLNHKDNSKINEICSRLKMASFRCLDSELLTILNFQFIPLSFLPYSDGRIFVKYFGQDCHFWQFYYFSRYGYKFFTSQVVSGCFFFK